MVKTLILDIETFPALVYAWGLWDQNVGLNQIVDRGGVACWAATWAGSDETHFSSVHMTDKRSMLREMYNMLEEADEVVGWNSNSFDIKHLNGEFWLQGWGPPAPFKRVDLMRVVKNNFKMLSNKLEFNLQERLGLHKMEHEGFPLWAKCMKGDKKAWADMETYNITDVLRTEELYETLRPWIPNSGINRSALLAGHCCSECGSTKVHSRGTARTTTQEYKRYQCQNCGTWLRENRPVGSKVAGKILVKVAR